MKYTLFILAFLFSIRSLAQPAEIRGILQDSAGVSLPFVTVILLHAKDSVMQEFATTDEKGQFKLKAEREKRYILQISLLGLETKWENIYTNGSITDLEIIKLLPLNTTLPTLEVLGQYDLMKIGKDTVEYNTKAFKVQPGAVVEDLLKKLPGIEVQRDGSVKAYGEDVKNILVDGKEFFGKDTRIATKNLEADAVDKVQVYDKKSDIADFTGVDDGQKEKSINLKLKEDHKNGYFGSAELAGGTDSRFKSKFNLNRFSPTSRISFIGTGNNINEQSFSMDDYIDFMGGIGSFMSGGGGRMRIELDESSGLPMGGGNIQGIQRSLAGGLNLNQTFSAKTELSASYLASNMKNNLSRSTARQSLFSEQTYNSNEDEDRISRNTNNTITFRLKSKLDSFQNLIIRGSGGWNDSKYNSALTNSTTLANNILANHSDRDYLADGGSYNFNSTLTWQRRFRKSGRYLVISGTARYNHNNREGNLDAINQYYVGAAHIDSILQNQLFLDRGNQLQSTISYTEPLGKKQYLEFSGSLSNNRNRTNTDFYDIIDPGIERRNDLLSADYNRGYLVNTIGLRYMRNQKKSHISYGIQLQNSMLNGTVNNAENPIRVNYARLLPEAVFQFDLGTAHNLNIDYSTDIQEPSLQQLQPTSNNADPLNIYIGNPDLKPEYIHRLGLSYFKYDQFNFTSIFGNIRASYTQNKITDLVDIDSLFRRTIQPINVKDEKALQGQVEFSTPIRPLKIMTKIKLRSQLANSILFVNNEKNKVDRFGNSVSFSIENRRKEKIDAMVGFKLSGSTSSYSVQKSLDQSYHENNIYGELTYTPNASWALHSEYDYLSYTQSNQPDKITVPLWRASLTKYIGKEQRLRLILSVFDILDRNKGISRNSQLNYLEIERTNALGRYYMLGLAYSIRGFKKAQGGIMINIDHGGDSRR
jgi:Outer membrane protein beta-barrel family